MHSEMSGGELYPGRDRPVARQMPNDEADKIWTEWELTRVFPIHKDDVLRLGKDLETAVKLEDKYYGLGDDVYAATLDVYHQLHCVNQLRCMCFHISYSFRWHIFRTTVHNYPKHLLIKTYLRDCLWNLLQQNHAQSLQGGLQRGSHQPLCGHASTGTPVQWKCESINDALDGDEVIPLSRYEC